MIVEASPAPSPTWEAIARVDPRATYFQTPGWSMLAARFGLGFEDGSLLVRLGDGARAVVPRMTAPAGGGWFLRFESVPVGCYGAPVAERPLDPGEARALVRLSRGRRCAGGVVVETPGDRLDLGVPRETISTHRLEWAPGTEGTTLLQGYRKGHRAAVRNAERRGVVIRRATSIEDYRTYHAIYLETVQRWDRQPFVLYSADLFATLGALSARDERIRLWLATLDERVLAGALTLHQGGNASYWHGASTMEGRGCNAGNLVVHAALIDAVEQGRTCFDFMPSASLSEVAQFKAGFGAISVEVGVHSFPGATAYRLLSGLAGRVRASAGGIGG